LELKKDRKDQKYPYGRLTIIPDNTPTVDGEYHPQFLKADIMDYLVKRTLVKK